MFDEVIVHCIAGTGGQQTVKAQHAGAARVIADDGDVIPWRNHVAADNRPLGQTADDLADDVGGHFDALGGRIVLRLPGVVGEHRSAQVEQKDQQCRMFTIGRAMIRCGSDGECSLFDRCDFGDNWWRWWWNDDECLKNCIPGTDFGHFGEFGRFECAVQNLRCAAVERFHRTHERSDFGGCGGQITRFDINLAEVGIDPRYLQDLRVVDTQELGQKDGGCKAIGVWIPGRIRRREPIARRARPCFEDQRWLLQAVVIHVFDVDDDHRTLVEIEQYVRCRDVAVGEAALLEQPY